MHGERDRYLPILPNSYNVYFSDELDRAIYARLAVRVIRTFSSDTSHASCVWTLSDLHSSIALMLLQASDNILYRPRELRMRIVALVGYDYVITWKHEYEFIWRRRWMAATWLFIINRYTLLASVILQAIPKRNQVSSQ